MEQTQSEVQQQTVSALTVRPDVSTVASASETSVAGNIEPQVCSTCGTTLPLNPGASQHRAPMAPSWVYAIGTVDALFPNRSVEKEFVQAAARLDTKNLTDRQALHKVLSDADYFYLVPELLWIMRIEDTETYVLMPRRESLFKSFVETLHRELKAHDFDAVIGEVVGISPPEKTNGLTLPVAVVDQIYFSDKETLIKEIPKTDKVDAKAFERAASEVFDRIMRIADNHGLGIDRAFNYALLRYPGLYHAVAEAYSREESLAGVEARYSALSGPQELVDIIISFMSRKSGVVSKQCMRFNTSGKFPFLVSPLAPCW